MDVSEEVISHLRHVHQVRDTYCSLHSSNLRATYLGWNQRGCHPLALPSRRKHEDLGSMTSIFQVVNIYFERARLLKSTQLCQACQVYAFHVVRIHFYIILSFSLFYLIFHQSEGQSEVLHWMNRRVDLPLAAGTSITRS